MLSIRFPANPNSEIIAISVMDRSRTSEDAIARKQDAIIPYRKPEIDTPPLAPFCSFLNPRISNVLDADRMPSSEDAVSLMAAAKLTTLAKNHASSSVTKCRHMEINAGPPLENTCIALRDSSLGSPGGSLDRMLPVAKNINPGISASGKGELR